VTKALAVKGGTGVAAFHHTDTMPGKPGVRGEAMTRARLMQMRGGMMKAMGDILIGMAAT